MSFYCIAFCCIVCPPSFGSLPLWILENSPTLKLSLHSLFLSLSLAWTPTQTSYMQTHTYTHARTNLCSYLKYEMLKSIIFFVHCAWRLFEFHLDFVSMSVGVFVLLRLQLSIVKLRFGGNSFFFVCGVKFFFSLFCNVGEAEVFYSFKESTKLY